jgi:hypothetical protein
MLRRAPHTVLALALALRAASSSAGDGPRLRITLAGRALPSPAAATAARHEGAVWAGPAGGWLAWLEGDTRERLAVRAGRWDGERWREVETVAPPGPGSQLALAAALGADGEPILVWAAFDGGDDEIVWSRRTADGWSRPARLAGDNRTPDILPALAAAPDGAFAAWSRYDGNDYRVVVARLRGGKWQDAVTVGPRGSYHAAVAAAAGGGAAVLYESAAGWEALELDRRGRPTGRRATVAGSPRPDDRAAITGADEQGLTVRWSEAGSTARVDWR